jgi:hypothetical protein
MLPAGIAARAWAVVGLGSNPSPATYQQCGLSPNFSVYKMGIIGPTSVKINRAFVRRAQAFGKHYVLSSLATEIHH